MEFGRAAAPLAVRSLRQIRELEVNGESFGDAVRLFDAQA
jgi:hypothetical protein